jgi:hypothetical protein
VGSLTIISLTDVVLVFLNPVQKRQHQYAAKLSQVGYNTLIGEEKTNIKKYFKNQWG